MLVCAVSEPFKSCRVVDCGKKINTEWSLDPTIGVEARDVEGEEEVFVTGNFMEW